MPTPPAATPTGPRYLVERAACEYCDEDVVRAVGSIGVRGGYKRWSADTVGPWIHAYSYSAQCRPLDLERAERKRAEDAAHEAEGAAQ